MDKETEKTLIQAIPMARRGTPEEMADVYTFLASDEPSYVTGALWPADGGCPVAKGPVGDLVPDKPQKEPRGILRTLTTNGTGRAYKHKTIRSRYFAG